ncbi:MAG TPA: hypothetical protein VGR52_02955 [Stellaceae bacterium]|nr:hypothetical protein [Stellaceae bacterium]
MVQVEDSASAANEVFVTYTQLSEQHGIPFSRRHLRDLVARGLFPAPRLLGANTIAWPLSALAAWKASRPTQQYQPQAHPEPTGKRKGAKRRSLENQQL